VDREWLAAVTRIAHRRIPLLRDVPLDVSSSWAGLYEMSPDKHAILGRAPGCDNLYLINGSSGHGVMHAPALGALLAELISDGKFSALDASALRPSRFAEGAPNPASGLL
jgi:sarcosine oxidase, subunit beta